MDPFTDIIYSADKFTRFLKQVFKVTTFNGGTYDFCIASGDCIHNPTDNPVHGGLYEVYKTSRTITGLQCNWGRAIHFQNYAYGGFYDFYYVCAQATTHNKIRDTPTEPTIYCWTEVGCNTDWKKLKSKTSKTFDTLYTEGGLGDRIRSRIQSFVRTRAGLVQAGVPPKLSIFAQGPRGTGKSSLIKAIANELDADLFLLDMNTVKNFGAMKYNLIDKLEPGRLSVIALEDIHLVNKAEFPHLYNLLDGVAELEGCVIVLTSNVSHAELDPALVRSGRVNFIVELGPILGESARRMCKAILPHQGDEVADIVGATVERMGGVLASRLESYLLNHIESTTTILDLPSLNSSETQCLQI